MGSPGRQMNLVYTLSSTYIPPLTLFAFSLHNTQNTHEQFCSSTQNHTSIVFICVFSLSLSIYLYIYLSLSLSLSYAYRSSFIFLSHTLSVSISLSSTSPLFLLSSFYYSWQCLLVPVVVRKICLFQCSSEALITILFNPFSIFISIFLLSIRILHLHCTHTHALTRSHTLSHALTRTHR